MPIKITDLPAAPDGKFRTEDEFPVTRPSNPGTEGAYKQSIANRLGDESIEGNVTITGAQTVTGDQTVTGTSYTNAINIDSGNASIESVTNNLEISSSNPSSIKGVIGGQTNFDANYDGTDNTFTVNGKVVTDLLQVKTGASAGKVLKSDADGNATWQTDSTGGDVTGPSSSVDNNLVSYDGTTGKIIQDAGVPASQVTTNMGNIAANTANIATNATAIATKLDEANSVFMPGYTKYCVDNRDDLSTVISSITNEGTVVYLSQGSFGGTTPLTINKDNIALIAPACTPAIVEFAYEITTASTADRIRMRYMQFDNHFNAASKRSTYNHCTFNQNLNIQTSASAGYMTFSNCEFAAETVISVDNTFASVVYFINCNFAGCSFSLNQASSQQVIFANCTNFSSFPSNATFSFVNGLSTGYVQMNVTKTVLPTGAGTAGQVLTSGGPNNPDTWTTISGGSGDVTGPASATIGNLSSFGANNGKSIQDTGIAATSLLTTSSNIEDLNNVSTTAPSDGQSLKYNSTSSLWEPGEDGGNYTTVYNTAGTGTETVPAGYKSVRITLIGCGGGGSGAGQSQLDQQSGYQGAGGSGGGMGAVLRRELPVKPGQVFYYNLAAGGAGGTGQGNAGTPGAPATGGQDGSGDSHVRDSSSTGGLILTATYGLGAGNPTAGLTNTQTESATGGNGYLAGGGAGQAGSNQVSGSTQYGSTAPGGFADPDTVYPGIQGTASTTSAPGRGGLNTASVGTGGSGAGPYGGRSTSASQNGPDGTFGCGGAGGNAHYNGTQYTPGTNGGKGGDAAVIFEYIA